MAMRRADRRDSNDDNAAKYPRSYGNGKEPPSLHELKQWLTNARFDRDKYQKESQEAASQLAQVHQEMQTYQVEANELKEQIAQNYQLYVDEQQKSQQTLDLYSEEKAKATKLLVKLKVNQEAASQLVKIQQEEIQTYQVEANELKDQIAQNYQLYADEQQKYQQTLGLYSEEKARTTELLVKYEAANSEREIYLTLYNEVKAELKYERRSKASIKGWETRRKAENAKLKQEIAGMVVLLRKSLASKDEAVNNLYVVAERMDRIQSLVNSVEEETTSNSVGLVQKFRRIWLAVKEILSE